MTPGAASTSPSAVLRAFLEQVWNAHDLSKFTAYVAADVRFHPPRGSPRDHAQYFEMATDFMRAFPDIHFDIGPIIEQGDMAAVQLVITGTNRGVFRAHAPTGRSVRVEGRPWARVREGQIVEFWQLFDELGMLHQLGHVVDDSLLGAPAR